MTKPLDALARGFRKRTLVTAKLAGKVGLKMARRTFGGKKFSPRQFCAWTKPWYSIFYSA